jgi:hypothetical protein
MPIPQLTPTPKPFREALAFHRSRVPMTDAEFARLSSEAKLRAFTVSGLARQSSVAEAYRLAEQALESGMTMKEFRDTLSAFLLANEGASLSAARIDLIFRQAIGTARSIGRYQQMTDPDMLERRPYWMYSLGPDDERTTEGCRELQGFVAPADSEVWNHIYPPNHFNERHSVVSLSESQAKGTGRMYEGPKDDQYPFVNGRRILPDPGFDFSPGLLSSDGEQLLAEIANLGEEVAAKTPDDYGLPKLADLPASVIPEAPDLLERMPLNTSPDDIEGAWARFRTAVGIPDGSDSTILVDADGDGVFVNRQSFDHIVGEDSNDPTRKIDGAGRAQFFGFFNSTIDEPLEIWWSPRRTNTGDIVFEKIYIAMYREPAGGRSFQVFLVRSPQGWLMYSGFPGDAAGVEPLRRGFLSYRSYGRSDQ